MLLSEATISERKQGKHHCIGLPPILLPCLTSSSASADQAGRGDAKSESTSKASSKARSPGPLTDDEEVPSLDQGIRLRKRPSVNFGAPLGQLGFRKL